MKKVTLRDIAEKSGISFSLVSKVLRNDFKGSAISLEKAKEVRRIASELGYVVNKQAQQLRTGKAHTIAVVIPVDKRFGLTVYPSLIQGILSVSIESTYDFIFFHSYGLEKEYENLKEIMAISPAGVIYAVPPKRLPDDTDVARITLLQQMANQGTPILFCMEKYKVDKTCSYLFDDYSGGYMGTKYLIDKGNVHIAFCISAFVERTQGYVAAMEDAGLNAYNLYGMCDDPFSANTGKIYWEVIKKRARKLPDAIFATCDLSAVGMLSAMKDDGVGPNDIEVLGYDGLPFVDLLETPFASVLQPVYKIGQDSAKAMLIWVEDGVKPVDKLYSPTIKLPTGDFDPEL